MIQTEYKDTYAAWGKTKFQFSAPRDSKYTEKMHLMAKKSEFSSCIKVTEVLVIKG